MMNDEYNEHSETNDIFDFWETHARAQKAREERLMKEAAELEIQLIANEEGPLSLMKAIKKRTYSAFGVTEGTDQSTSTMTEKQVRDTFMPKDVIPITRNEHGRIVSVDKGVLGIDKGIELMRAIKAETMAKYKLEE